MNKCHFTYLKVEHAQQKEGILINYMTISQYSVIRYNNDNNNDDDNDDKQ